VEIRGICVKIGVDGIRNGWIAASRDGGNVKLRRHEDLRELAGLAAGGATIAVDMPIGLLSAAEPGGRECERVARRLLGRRSSSVFPSPARKALVANEYAAAVLINRSSSNANLGISKQAFALFSKLREIDASVTPELQERIIEVHPELCFTMMRDEVAPNNPDLANLVSKSSKEGLAQRASLLILAGFHAIQKAISEGRSLGAKADDVLDACVAVWTAERKANGRARRFPDLPPVDVRGLRMEMWA
jgi:predicted RNase H-like nuclease